MENSFRALLRAALVSAGLALGAGCGSPERIETRPAQYDLIRVLVYNIHAGTDAAGESNLQRVAELIRSQEADIVLLQEVDRRTERSGRVDQLAELERLTGFHGVFGRTLDYQGGDYGIAMLSRWPIRSDTLVPLRVEPEQERAGGSYEPRGALRVAVAAPAELIGVLNTHLAASSEDAFRRQEVVTVRREAKWLREEHGLAVVGGDFNDDPESAVIGTMREAGWTDAWRACGDGERGYTYPAEHPERRIDYLFLSGGWTCDSATVLPSRASDHRPLLVTLRRTS